MIAVNLSITLKDDEKEHILRAYLDYLKSTFKIIVSTGYEKGHISERNKDEIGIIDF